MFVLIFCSSEGNYSVAENEYNAVDMDINIANKEATLTMVGDPFLSVCEIPLSGQSFQSAQHSTLEASQCTEVCPGTPAVSQLTSEQCLEHMPCPSISQHPKQLTLDRPLEHSSQTSERVANAPKPSEKEKDETLAENAPKVLQDLENAFTGLMSFSNLVNLNLKAIPAKLTCTQLPQKWNVPSGSSKTLDKAVKLDHLLFEKADVNKTSKRCLVKGIREEYCATPPFALTVTEEKIKRMSNAFREVTQTSLFCKALESNSYKPYELFNTSCSRQKRQRLLEECTGNLEQTPEYILVEEIFKNVPRGHCPPAGLNDEQLNHAIKSVGVTVSAAKEICLSTMQQSKDHRWYAERSKRVTASVFGKIINRRKSLYPKSLIQSITKQIILL